MINLGNRNPNESLVIFLHIPKAGGTTLNGIINQQYPKRTTFRFHGIETWNTINDLPQQRRESLRLIRGHFAFGLHQFLPCPTTYFTLLRDPIARFVSEYHYIRRSPGLKSHEQLQAMTLEEYVDVKGQGAGNLQTRLIFGLSKTSATTPSEVVATAKRNLDQYFGVVGLVEQFDETLVLLQKQFNWRSPVYVQQNVTSAGEKKRAAIADATLEKIKQCNAMDLELYEYAVHKFEQQVAEISDFEQRLKKQKTVNTLYQPMGRAYNLARSLVLQF
jgi:Galactose-3-O-sulfotransferase